MKVIVFLAALAALCAGSAIPTIPGDNSHYVEGVSRYIWMPADDGTPILVDLHAEADEGPGSETRNGQNNQYWLYTRENPNQHQVLVNGDVNSVRNSNFDANKPIKVLVHGWNNNGNSEMNHAITSAFLEVADVNVIVVDWRRLAGNLIYNLAARGVPDVGKHVGEFLDWLINNVGGKWDDVHLVGFSLGAHVVGNAGRTVDGKIGRITGLDPAGPTWGRNSRALTRTDGQYVECIHTDGGLLGIFDPIGDADFYPNGGRNPQPNCWISTCSHSRAWDLFAASVRFDHFTGLECNDLNEARRTNCNGSGHKMGNHFLNKEQNTGLYGLKTERRWPY